MGCNPTVDRRRPAAPNQFNASMAKREGHADQDQQEEKETTAKPDASAKHRR